MITTIKEIMKTYTGTGVQMSKSLHHNSLAAQANKLISTVYIHRSSALWRLYTYVWM